jgi:hypothetical protein
MKIYRLKHIPTGLYFCPTKTKFIKDNRIGQISAKRMVKTNLDPVGKVYTRKPTSLWLDCSIWNHLEPNGLRTTDPNDWEVEECSVT